MKEEEEEDKGKDNDNTTSEQLLQVRYQYFVFVLTGERAVPDVWMPAAIHCQDQRLTHSTAVITTTLTNQHSLPSDTHPTKQRNNIIIDRSNETTKQPKQSTNNQTINKL
jgi:hypothetical protein